MRERAQHMQTSKMAQIKTAWVWLEPQWASRAHGQRWQWVPGETVGPLVSSETWNTVAKEGYLEKLRFSSTYEMSTALPMANKFQKDKEVLSRTRRQRQAPNDWHSISFSITTLSPYEHRYTKFLCEDFSSPTSVVWKASSFALNFPSTISLAIDLPCSLVHTTLSHMLFHSPGTFSFSFVFGWPGTVWGGLDALKSLQYIFSLHLVTT